MDRAAWQAVVHRVAVLHSPMYIALVHRITVDR